MHIADNGDGTFTNPVMPNGHWSDPAVILVGDAYYCVTSSIETCPLMQILESRDLVNWDVIGSVSRGWLDDLPTIQNWSPRICHIDGAFRIYFHITERGFAIMESIDPAGPYRRIADHRLGDMTGQWAPSVFQDDDGRRYMVCANWIQELSGDGLSFVGRRFPVAEGFLENPWLIKRGDRYYWFCSENGTDAWGMMPDKSKVSVWRSKSVLGPYEKCPRPLIGANLGFQCPNTGCAVPGPDNRWWYVYNTYEVQRPTLCRQLHVDPVEWDPEGWPVVNNGSGPGLTHPKPVRGHSPRWIPALDDEFDASGLEGVSSGVLGRKWLFKREDASGWSLAKRKGFLRLKVGHPSFNDRNPATVVVQRPVSAYYSVETMMEFAPAAAGQQAGLLVKELHTGCGVAIGIEQTDRPLLKVWHDRSRGMEEVAAVRFDANRSYLRIDVEGLLFRCSYSVDNRDWSALGPEYSYVFRTGYFSAFHPGLFAGEKVQTKTECHADFDYFRCIDREAG